MASWGVAFFSSPLGRKHNGRKDLLLTVAGESFEVLLHAAPELSFDEDLVEAAMTGQDARSALERTDSVAGLKLKKAWESGVALSLRSNPTFIKRILSQHGRLLCLLERHQRSDRTFVTEAVRNDGLSKNEGAFFKPDDQPCWLYTCKVQDLVSQPLLQ